MPRVCRVNFFRSSLNTGCFPMVLTRRPGASYQPWPHGYKMLLQCWPCYLMQCLLTLALLDPSTVVGLICWGCLPPRAPPHLWGVGLRQLQVSVLLLPPLPPPGTYTLTLLQLSQVPGSPPALMLLQQQGSDNRRHPLMRVQSRPQTLHTHSLVSSPSHPGTWVSLLILPEE